MQKKLIKFSLVIYLLHFFVYKSFYKWILLGKEKTDSFVTLDSLGLGSLLLFLILLILLSWIASVLHTRETRKPIPFWERTAHIALVLLIGFNFIVVWN